MISEVYYEFFKQRAKIAGLLKLPVNLVGMYYNNVPQGTCYIFKKLLVPNASWDKSVAASLGYNSNTVLPPTAGIRTYFDLENPSYSAAFYLDRLPGCCGSAHLHDMITHTEGMGKIMLEMAELAAYFNGYRLITGTVIEKFSGLRAVKLIEKYGWERHRSFTNQRTGNTVYLVSKELTATNAGRRIDDGASKSSNQSSGVKIATVARSAGFSAQ